MDFHFQYWRSTFGMMQEWFCDMLKENGHMRLDSLMRVTEWATPDHVRARLSALWDSVHTFEVPVEDYLDAHERSRKVVDHLEENGTDLGEWTSLIHDGRLVFAFRSAIAATQFRLIWP